VRRTATYAIVPVLLLALWQAMAIVAGRRGLAFTGPADVAGGAAVLMTTGMPPGHLLLGHLAFSLGRVVLGFGCAAIVGVLVGLASGSSSTVNRLVRPLVDFFRPIPPLAWVPLAIGWFGIGVRAAAFIIFLGAVFPIFVSTCAGVSRVPRSTWRSRGR